MDTMLLIAAFGGGALAALFGGIVALAFTGLTLFGVMIAGNSGTLTVDLMGFSAWFGPHVSLVAAVAAATFATSRGYAEDGQDLVTPLIKYKDPMIVAVGGAFGVVGYLVQVFVAKQLGFMIPMGFLTAGGAAWTSTIALTVLIMGVIVRFTFGKTGLVGKKVTFEKREWIPKGDELTITLILGASVGVIIGAIVSKLGTQGLIQANKEAVYLFEVMPYIGFGIAAMAKCFMANNRQHIGWHHIALSAGSTAVIIFSATHSVMLTVFGAIIMGMLSAFIGESTARTFNAHCDTHIDPPAVTLCVTQLFNAVVLSGLIFS